MHKKTLALSVIFLSVLFVGTSCKKSSTPKANPNSPAPLSTVFYVRGLLDTTWFYLGDNNPDECQSGGSLCSAFLTYGPNNSIPAVKFSFIDSAHVVPKDSVILGWAGKTFVTASDNSVSSHAYLFAFEYPDTSGIEMSSDYVINNVGAKLTVDSVIYDGLSQQGYTDSLGNPLKCYKLKGTLSCQVAHLGDTTRTYHKVTQGVYSINVMEAK